MQNRHRAADLPVRLVCPRCRIPDASGNLEVVFLQPQAAADATEGPDWGFDRCPKCGNRYPRIEGIRCVPPDLKAFQQAQSEALDREWAVCAETRENALRACKGCAELDPASDSFREAYLPGLYALAHFPEPIQGNPLRSELSCNSRVLDLLREWLRVHHTPDVGSAGCALDVGCGPGRFLHELAPVFPRGALGLDLRLSMLRLAQRLVRAGEVQVGFREEGRRFMPTQIIAGRNPDASIHLVQGDIVFPPFEAEVFPLVCALSLLDTVHDPVFVLGQLDALLCPGGLLVLATPYHWEPGITSPDSWLCSSSQSGAETLRRSLQGGNSVIPHLNYELLEEMPMLPWAMPGHGRLVHRFFLDFILARKRP